jgi:predicted branched-subunit amino acid permease
MSLSLSQKLDSTTHTGLRLLFGFGITDEVYAIAVTEKEKINARYMFGIITLPIIGWVLGTTLGAFASKLIPDEKLLDALSIALYAMFIAIIIPDARRSLKITFVILLSISISCLFYYVPFIKEIGIGFKIIISTVISALLGAIIFPINDEINEIEYSSKDGDDNA